MEIEKYKLIAIKEQEECEKRTIYIEQVNQTNKDLKYEVTRLTELVARLSPFEQQALMWKQKYEDVFVMYEKDKQRFEMMQAQFYRDLEEFQREMDRMCEFQQREILKLSEALAYEQLECQRHYQEKDLIHFHYKNQFGAFSSHRAGIEDTFDRLRAGLLVGFPQLAEYVSTKHG